MMRLFFVIFLIFVQSVPLSAQDPEPLDVPSILRTVTSLLSSDPKSLEYCKNFTDYLNLLEPPITSENITHSIKSWVRLKSFPLMHAPTAAMGALGQQLGHFLGLPALQTPCPQHLKWITAMPFRVEPHDYITGVSLKMGQAVYGLTLEQRMSNRERINPLSKRIFLNLYHEQDDRIPHISHRAWITSSSSPKEPSLSILHAYLDSLKKLTGRWDHNFWCMNPDDIPQTIATLRQSKIPIQIRRIEEIYPQMQAKHIFDAYYQNGHFCLASDIVKQNIGYLIGGVISDLGASFLEDLTPLVNAYDYLFPHKFSGFSDFCFFASRPNNPVFKDYLNLIDRLPYLPQEAKRISPNPNMQNIWISGATLMLSIDRILEPTDRVFFIPEDHHSYFWINHGASWLKRNDPYGNTSIMDSTVDLFTLL